MLHAALLSYWGDHMYHKNVEAAANALNVCN